MRPLELNTTTPWEGQHSEPDPGTADQAVAGYPVENMVFCHPETEEYGTDRRVALAVRS